VDEVIETAVTDATVFGALVTASLGESVRGAA
jgi:hypothetical protein